MHLYEILNKDNGVVSEIRKIADLFEKAKLLSEYPNCHSDAFSIESYINKYEFLSWPHRGLYLTTTELKQCGHFNNIFDKMPTEEVCFLYLEYVWNMICLYQKTIYKYAGIMGIQQNEKAINALLQNIELFISKLNKKFVEIEKDLFILIEDSPELTEAVNILGENKIISPLLEYNHVSIRNDVNAKEGLLLILAKDFEARSSVLKKSTKWKDLADDLSFLFNNIDIRHNNVEGKYAKPVIQNMTEPDLLNWYNITYRLYLTCVLAGTYNEKLKSEIEGLKQQVSHK